MNQTASNLATRRMLQKVIQNGILIEKKGGARKQLAKKKRKKKKIPEQLIKIMFLGETEIVLRSGIKSTFYIMDFSTSDAILGQWSFGVCFFNTTMLKKSN